jgi:hypothetical protein
MHEAGWDCEGATTKEDKTEKEKDCNATTNRVVIDVTNVTMPKIAKYSV